MDSKTDVDGREVGGEYREDHLGSNPHGHFRAIVPSAFIARASWTGSDIATSQKG
jgi:hypothetical protein